MTVAGTRWRNSTTSVQSSRTSLTVKTLPSCATAAAPSGWSDQPETAAFSAGFASNVRSFSGTTVPRAVLAETAVTVNFALPKSCQSEWTSCRASTLPLPG